MSARRSLAASRISACGAGLAPTTSFSRSPSASLASAVLSSAVSAAVSAVVSFELEEQPAKDAAASSARNVVPKNDFYIVISSSLCV